MEASPIMINTLRELLSKAKERAQVLKSDAEEAARVEKVWWDLLSCLERGWPIHILTILEKESNMLKNMRSENQPAVSVLAEAYRIAKENALSIQRRYPGYLEEAFRQANLPLDIDSRHPRYSFEHKFFQLEIDEQTWVARLSDHEGRLGEIPADISAVVEMTLREHKRVFGRPFDKKRFLNKIRRQYLAILRKEKRTDGESLPIRQITRRLGKNEKGFHTDEFLVDLSRLIEHGPLEVDGRQLDLEQTKDTNQGMLLYGNAGRGYIGFIKFREG